MRISLVGIGMGSAGTVTAQACEAIEGADVLIGAGRMLQAALELASNPEGKKLVDAISPGDIASAIEALDDDTRVGIICSGDTGFYSLAQTIRKALGALSPKPEIELIPGITTVQCMAAKLGRPWQGVKLASAHGRSCNFLGTVLANGESFFLTGGSATPATMIAELVESGLGELQVAVGERLSYADERILCGKASELLDEEFDSLAAIWITRGELADEEVAPFIGFSGIPDELFTRGKAPMTKQEVRALVTSKLRPQRGETVFDVGAGTGSVAIETAGLNPFAHIFAIEKEPEACELIEVNRRRFGTFNVQVVEGRAPEAFEGLPAPDAAFIGGSTGDFGAIIDRLLELNPSVRIVATAVTMETVSQATDAFGKLTEQGKVANFSATQVGVTRTRQAGRYHLLSPESPIYIFEAQGAGERA
ncbi:MAG: precorrin-6y C5,15-methyltransferase (decarboxylating) subunit CbiE [Coriobacteriales bacterium]|nr:precorrin-6y C5,15-methyltransferase (decarboxylating) subunit CbiE [Coriobacteriales bacterium]